MVTASIGGNDVELQEQDGHFKGTVGLVPGDNTITVKYGTQTGVTTTPVPGCDFGGWVVTSGSQT